MTKHQKLSVRDYEDMTRIELDDEIARLEKVANVNGQDVFTEEQWAALVEPIVKQNSAAIVIQPSGVGILFGGIQYESDRGRIAGSYRRFLDETTQTKPVQIVYENLGIENRKKVAAFIAKAQKDRVALEDAYKSISALKEKRENYKDLAARFRLGYTGDPSDKDAVNKRLQEFLLGTPATTNKKKGS